jgi:hypothetical protein
LSGKGKKEKYIASSRNVLGLLLLHLLPLKGLVKLRFGGAQRVAKIRQLLTHFRHRDGNRVLKGFFEAISEGWSRYRLFD